MAGIGVRLNRIFEKNTLTTNLVGFFYSTVVTVAPMFVIIINLPYTFYNRRKVRIIISIYKSLWIKIFCNTWIAIIYRNNTSSKSLHYFFCCITIVRTIFKSYIEFILFQKLIFILYSTSNIVFISTT